MLVSKSFVVTGETVHRNGKKEKDIAANVDAAINDFLAKNPGKLVHLIPNVNIGPTQDNAFVTIVLDVEKAAEPVVSTKEKIRQK
jgi:hypothetical protein